MNELRKIILIGGIILLLVFVFVIWFTKNENPEQPATTCPADTKVCPDGSNVGRVGSDCKFAECPENNDGKINENEDVTINVGNEKFTFEITNDWQCDWDDVFYKTVCDATRNTNCPSCPAEGRDLTVTTSTKNASEVLKDFDNNPLYTHSELNKIKVGNYDAYEFIETDTRRKTGYYSVILETPKNFAIKFNFFKIPAKESLRKEESLIISSFKSL